MNSVSLRIGIGLCAVLLPGCATHAVSENSRVPAPKPPLRILALGDSITRGSGSGYGNYRRPLQSLLSRAGVAYQFVGGSTELSLNYHGTDPEQAFNPYQPGHEGYGGFRIEQISADTPAKDDGGVSYPGLSAALTADKPDVILVLLGTNDVSQSFDPGGPGYGGGSGFAADAAGRLDTLLTRLGQLAPGARVIVGQITPLADPAKEAQVRAYNALIPRVAAAHGKQGGRIQVADMHAAVAQGDLSPDGVHPGTLGYDKMARAWYKALTGKTPPPLPAAPANHGPGRLGEANLFTPSTTVTVSSTFAGAALAGARLVDAGPKAFVFGDITSERASLSGVSGPITRLRFFDAPSYTGRTPAHVTVYASPAAQTSLNPSDYVSVGTFPLPVIGDAYEGRTDPPAHPDPSDPAVRPAATIGFCDLDGLKIPAGTRSLLLDFGKTDGYGDGLSEIQAFAK